MERGRIWKRAYANLKLPKELQLHVFLTHQSGAVCAFKASQAPCSYRLHHFRPHRLWPGICDRYYPTALLPPPHPLCISLSGLAPSQIQEHCQDKDLAPPFPLPLHRLHMAGPPTLGPRPVRVGSQPWSNGLCYTPTEFDKTPHTFSSLHINVFYKLNNHKGYSYQNTVNTNF